MHKLLALQSGAHIGGAHRDFHPIKTIHPVPHIAVDQESLAAHSGSLSSVLSSSLYMVTLRLSQVTSTIQMCSGWVWMAIRSTDLTTLLSLRWIAQTVRVDRPDSQGPRIETSKERFSTHERKTKAINILLIILHLNCCQPLRSHYCVNLSCRRALSIAMFHRKTMNGKKEW